MTYEEAKECYFNELKDTYRVLTIEELIAGLGKTTIRCGWVDYIDRLVKNKAVDYDVAKDWGQVI